MEGALAFQRFVNLGFRAEGLVDVGSRVEGCCSLGGGLPDDGVPKPMHCLLCYMIVIRKAIAAEAKPREQEGLAGYK